MNNTELRNLQQAELRILQEVDRICKKYDLTYFLAWGTALGALRHQGFIPWDDDIDLMMPWEDYQKFHAIVDQEIHQEFYCQDCFKEPDLYVYWMKMRLQNTVCMLPQEQQLKIHWGIGIDIFPLFPMKDRQIPFIKRFIYILMRFLCNRSYICCKGYPATLKKRILRMVYACIPKRFSQKWIHHLLMKFGETDQTFAYYIEPSEGLGRCCFPKDVMETGRTEQFEGKTYPVAKNLEAYLNACYGEDYMQVPELHDQMNHGDLILKFDDTNE